MQAEVNTADAPNQELQQSEEERVETEERGATLSGWLTRTPTGPVRALLLATGLALVVWIGRSLLALLGYRHAASMSLGQGALDLRGQRRFMGVSIGETRRVLPLASVRRVDLVGRSALWALLAAVGVLVVAGGAGATLLLWGVSGKQPSWILLGLLVLGLGVFLDSLAYLWVKLSLRRSRADLKIFAARSCYRLSRVPLDAANELIDELVRRRAEG
jgi:hypothetical protein